MNRADAYRRAAARALGVPLNRTHVATEERDGPGYRARVNTLWVRVVLDGMPSDAVAALALVALAHGTGAAGRHVASVHALDATWWVMPTGQPASPCVVQVEAPRYTWDLNAETP